MVVPSRERRGLVTQEAEMRLNGSRRRVAVIVSAAFVAAVLPGATAIAAVAAVGEAGEAAEADTCQTKTYSIGSRTFTKFVPSHVRGDRDYNGNGPDVDLKASLELITNSSGGTTGRVRLAMTAVETVSDWTTVNGVRYTPLFVTDAGYRVDRIVDSTGRNVVIQDSKYYRDTDHADDLLGPGYVTSTYFTSFVSRYVVTGDTSGDEAGTRTGVTLTTRAFTVYASTC